MLSAVEYLNDNRDRFLEELFELIRIPSVSADPKYDDDMLRAAQWLCSHFKQLKVDLATVYTTKGHPIVYAEKIIDKDLPTVLVYGHYDVQPADPLELWDSDPFEPIIKTSEIHPNGAIYARGACDDKGQVFMHLKAFEALMKNNSLSCNVKFLIEGEEEVGSPNLAKFCVEHKSLLKSDMILISDTSIIDNQTPSITVGLRGLSYVEVEVVSANRDLHSGVYGGTVANPINVLCTMIASLQDKDNHITIPGFYDDVAIVSDEERKELNKVPFDVESYKKKLQIPDIHGESGYTSIERLAIRPTIDVNGIWGGYTGKGAKTVLPAKAYAKISMRLVPHQNDTAITELFTKHFESIAPKSVTVKVTPHHGGMPVITPTDTVEYKAAALAMEQSYQKTPIPYREGASIPIVALFEEILGVKTVLMGFGLDTDALHSPNEHFGVENFTKGIETIIYFYQNYNNLKNKDIA